MAFDRFIDDWQIGDDFDTPDFKDCKQCGESFETNCHAAIDEEYCCDDCEAMHGGLVK